MTVDRDWDDAIRAFERELGVRGLSAHTLRAYHGDLGELAEWASERGTAPGKLAYRDLRGYAAALSERGLARSSVARKLAAIRAFGEHLVKSGVADQNAA